MQLEAKSNNFVNERIKEACKLYIYINNEFGIYCMIMYKDINKEPLAVFTIFTNCVPKI